MSDPSTTLPLLALAPQPRPTSVNYGFNGDRTDLRACSAAIRRGSKSFHLASLLLPARVRQATHALYGFCRHSDDLVDDPRAGPEALARLHDRLEAIYAGSPAAHPIDRAFARVVRDHAIPKSVPLALLGGFLMLLVAAVGVILESLAVMLGARPELDRQPHHEEVGL